MIDKGLQIKENYSLSKIDRTRNIRITVLQGTYIAWPLSFPQVCCRFSGPLNSGPTWIGLESYQTDASIHSLIHMKTYCRTKENHQKENFAYTNICKIKEAAGEQAGQWKIYLSNGIIPKQKVQLPHSNRRTNY